MHLMDQALSHLIAKGTRNGYLTYGEVNEYLPDEDVNPEKLDTLLLAIERNGIRLIEHSEKPSLAGAGKAPEPRVSEVRGAEDSRIQSSDIDGVASGERRPDSDVSESDGGDSAADARGRSRIGEEDRNHA